MFNIGFLNGYFLDNILDKQSHLFAHDDLEEVKLTEN